jgi:hypothetical protein
MPNAASEPLAEVADLIFDLEVNVSLHGVEAGHVNQHRCMFVFLPAKFTYAHASRNASIASFSEGG